MPSEHTNTAAERSEPATSLDQQSLLERIAFLEDQIAELRRAHMAEKAWLAPRRAAPKNVLRRIYFALANEPVVGPVVRRVGRVARIFLS